MKKEIIEKLSSLNENEKFLMTLTVYNKKEKKEKLNTFLFVNKFPYTDIEGTKKAICELLDKEGERFIDSL